MGKADPGIVLEEFKSSLKQIKSLVAWQELKNSERNSNYPPAFVMHDPTKIDLNNEYSRIIAISFKLDGLLNNYRVRTLTIVRTRREYFRLKQELNALNVPSRISGLL